MARCAKQALDGGNVMAPALHTACTPRRWARGKERRQMPIYFNPHGKTVGAHEALTDGSQLRPGYRSQMVEGEYISFDLSLMDAAPAARSTFMTDDITAAVNQARQAHTQKFAFLGDRAPRFDEASAIVVAQAKARARSAETIRDTARQRRNEPGDPAYSSDHGAQSIGAGNANPRAFAAMARARRSLTGN